MNTFPNLFQPGNIGSMQLKNRIIMPAMGVPLADEHGRVTHNLITYYQARAKGGTGLIISQFASVSSDAELPFTLNIYDDSYIDDWKKLTREIHRCGSKVCVQLMHTGMLFLFVGYVPEGITIKVPSITPLLKEGMPYDEISGQDIERYIEDFAEGARRVKEAGADAVELHASNGCLVSTFMSPVTNKRTDKYGGNTENRTRFARMIVERIRDRVGPNFPVIVRINVTDDIEGGISIDEVIQQAKILETAGTDCLNISSGLEYWTSSTIPCYIFPDAPMMPLTEKVKNAVQIPVIGSAKINAEAGEQILAAGRADFIAMGRPLLADPDLPDKISSGRLDEVRRCLYCNNCMMRLATGTGSGICSVNPWLFRESEDPSPPAQTPKKVMVIGGGLAGMQTALFLAQRGHKVHLYEKTGMFGGQWNIAGATPGKSHYTAFVDYLRRSLSENDVPVTFGTELTPEKILELKPDAVVVATGAVPSGLNVPGADGENVIQGHDIIEGKAHAHGRTVIIGGRFTGMEVALILAEQKQDVCIVTQAGLGQNGVQLEKMNFRALARKLIDLRVPLYLHSKVLEITDKAVIINLDDNIFSLDADTVILAIGMRPDNRLFNELKDTAIDVFQVGDCAQPGDAAAVAYMAASVSAEI
jgi:2,4-dienoyl-CoA reductase-like NADH-dependent reductase (Old Yellow Enzyme family)/thioredoxin reductase